MSLFKYLIILGICTGLCWLSWFFVLFQLNPEAGWFAFVFFYLSLGLALAGSFSIAGVILRDKFSKEDMPYKQVRVASRHALLFSLLIIIALLLQSQRWLTWWNLLILIVVAVLVELFSLSYKKFNK